VRTKAKAKSAARAEQKDSTPDHEPSEATHERSE